MKHDADIQEKRSIELARMGLTRRQVVKGAVILGASAIVGPLISACGGSGGTAVEESPIGAASPRAGGTLTVGMSGGSIKDTLNPYIAENTIDHSRNAMLHDALVRWDENYRPKYMLATEITPSQDAQTWTIRIRDDVVFHDGTPMTADDIVYSFKRMLDPKEQSYAGSSLASVDRSRIRKVDQYTVELGLKFPNAVLMDSLCEIRTVMVPQGFDPKHPIGSGPFKFKSFTAGERCELVANREYWGEGPYVDSYITLDFPDDTARVNALLSDAVDAIVEVPQAQIPLVESTAGVKLLRQESGRFDPFDMMVDHEPFSDVRVRQALRLVVDRAQMLQAAVSGYGRLGNDMYGPFDPGYPADIPQREQDVEQAKSLLKQAGYEDLDVELVFAPLTQGLTEAATVFVEQASAAGVKVHAKKVDEALFWDRMYHQAPFILEYYSVTRNYLAQTLLTTGPDAPWNVTNWDDPEWNKLVSEAFKTIDEDKRNSLVSEAAKIEHERGGIILWGFKDNFDAYNERVQGFTSYKGGLPLSSLGMNRVWLA